MANNTINNFETLDNHALEQVVGGSGWMDYINGFLKGFEGKERFQQKTITFLKLRYRKKAVRPFSYC